MRRLDELDPTRYRIYDADASPARVRNDLVARPVETLVMREAGTGGARRSVLVLVDDAFRARLAALTLDEEGLTLSQFLERVTPPPTIEELAESELVSPVADAPSGGCPRCGRPNPSDLRFCMGCGSPLGSSSLPPRLVHTGQFQRPGGFQGVPGAPRPPLPGPPPMPQPFSPPCAPGFPSNAIPSAPVPPLPPAPMRTPFESYGSYTPNFILECPAPFYREATPSSPLAAPVEITLHARLDHPDGWAVRPGSVTEFVLTLSLEHLGSEAVSALIRPMPGATSVPVFATVSSTDFAPESDAAEWVCDFAVPVELPTWTRYWTFRAVPCGSGPLYSIKVKLLVHGRPVQAIERELVRLSGSDAPRRDYAPSTMNVGVPRSAAHAQVVEINSQGSALHALAFYRGGSKVHERTVNLNLAPILQQFNCPASFDELHRIANAVYVPFRSIAKFLAEAPADEPVVFRSETWVCPFEVMQFPGAQGPTFLGAEREVLRWVDDVALPDDAPWKVERFVCVRPDYRDSALPAAVEEEAALHRRHARMEHVGDVLGFNGLLDSVDVDLVHFAGHASEGGLQVPDANGDVVEMGRGRFNAWNPLFLRRPMMFVNGCRAASGAVGRTILEGQLPVELLTAGVRALVAPSIRVDSGAALDAALCFYDQIRAGASVGRAVKAIHALALQGNQTPVRAATFLSYLAFAAPGQRITFG